LRISRGMSKIASFNDIDFLATLAKFGYISRQLLSEYFDLPVLC